MPTPTHLLPKLKRGPQPTCDCEDCPKCKARIRQRKFYENNLLKVKSGKEIEEEEWDSTSSQDC